VICKVNIRFEPKAKGFAEAALGSTSNAASEVAVGLTGTGI
jgi:hypothetical protein